MKFIKIIITLLFISTFQNCAKEVIAPLKTPTSKKVAFNPAHPKAAEFQAILEKYVKKGLPGVTMVVYTPEDGKWAGSAGVAKIETQEPMHINHIFHSASVAKTFHAVAAMILVDEGKLDIDKTIDTYLPNSVCTDLANRNKATVRQLMNHTSGIPDFIEQKDHITDYFNDLMQTFTTEQYLDYVCGKKADFEPGKRAKYSNTNTVLLALIMDNITGSHADVITEKIIKKLGLQQTFYKNEKGYPSPDGAVNTYVDMRGNGELINSTNIERNFAQMNIGHDAMMASANDYFTFLHGLFNGKLVSKKSLQEMIKYKAYPASIQIGEGLGLAVVKTPLNDLTRAGHDGGSLGAANLVQHYIEKNTTVVICSNFGGFINSPLFNMYYSPLIGHQNVILGEVELLLFGK